MKKLQLKIQDLTNPTILSHHEIKNILGGSASAKLICTGPGFSEEVPTYTCNTTPGGLIELCLAVYSATVTATCTQHN